MWANHLRIFERNFLAKWAFLIVSILSSSDQGSKREAENIPPGPRLEPKRQCLQSNISASTSLGVLLARSHIPSSEMQKDSWPVLKFLLELLHPSEDLLPHFIEYGVKDGSTLLAFFRMLPQDRKVILEKWVEDKKITQFQFDYLEIALNKHHTQVLEAFPEAAE